MAEEVDVVIIGGGIAGASVAYFLAELGVRDVLVLERSTVAAGASGRASGLVVFCEANHPGQAALLKASADFYATWEQQIGGPSAIARVGALMPVSAVDLASLEREVGIMQAAGHDVRLLASDEIATVAPGWYIDDVAAAAYSPSSGYIDPPMVTTAIMNRARALGVRVYQGAEVEAIDVQGGQVTGVVANRGRITAPVVIIAAGAWSAPLGWLVGANLEVWPHRAHVMHLKPPAGMPFPFPVSGDDRNHVYFRPEPGGLVLAADETAEEYPEEPPADPDHFDPTPPEWYGRWVVQQLSRRMPAMRDAEIVGGHAGVLPKGPDNYPLLGAMQEARGLYCICDTGGNGMTASPGLGRALAEQIVYGKTFLDIHPFRPSRFAEHEPITQAYRHSHTEPPVSWTLEG
ncbi:MAG: putative dependent oxidoreductase [Chloroflexi bacterium]|nr:putative dependent oxidoreductase [Chloroflexota bacterium]